MNNISTNQLILGSGILSATGNSLYLNGNIISGGAGNIVTGSFYPSDSNPSGYLTGIPNIVYTTGTQSITGVKTFNNNIKVSQLGLNTFNNFIDFNSGVVYDNNGFFTLDWIKKILYGGNNTNPTIIWSYSMPTLSGAWQYNQTPLSNYVALQTNRIDFTKTGNFSLYQFPIGYNLGTGTFYSVPNNYLFIIDTMEIITTNILSPSTPPVIAFGNTPNISGYVSPIQTTSNSQYSRHIFDNPQDAIPGGTNLLGSIISPSTATQHSGYFIYKGYLINS